MKIKVYSTPVCFWCNKLKQFLREHKIEFKEVNVMEDKKAAKEMIKKSGQNGVPVIDIDGDIIVGFDEEKIKKILKIK